MRTRPFSPRWATVAFVLAFLGSTFAAGTHWLSVPHRVCEVHGTIEHGPGSEATPPEGTRSSGPIVRETVPPHDACTLGPYTRTEMVPLAEVEGRGLFVAEACGRVSVPATPVASVPLFLLAPSRSPPA